MIKAFFLGLGGVAVVASLTYFNDLILRQSILISHSMPALVYGGLILFLVLLNPLLFKIGKRLGFGPSQLAVVLAMTLSACTVPGFGLMRYLGTTLIMPHQHLILKPGWKEQNVLDLAPKKMLADPGKNETEVLTGFMHGMGVGQKHISFSQIPWYAWTQTLMFWLPLVVTLWILLIALSVIVHKQWSQHEQLPYPITKFANAILPAEGSLIPELFRNRMFLIACFTLIVIRLMNYLYLWYPNFIQIPTRFNFNSLADLFPTFKKGGSWYYILDFNVYFTVIAFAFFITSSVSLSLGLGPILWCWIAGMFANFGISLHGSGGYLSPSVLSFMNFGTYIGFVAMTLYWGRFYYSNVFKKALFLPSSENIESSYIWSARIFLVTFVFLVIYISSIGLDWQLAFLYMIGAVIIFLVMGRIVAETGYFFIQAFTFPCVLMWGLMGERALGPKTLLLMFAVTTVILLDPRESIVPYLVNSFKLIDLHKVPIGRTAIFCAIAVLVCLGIALPLTFYFQYDRGADFADGWGIAAAGFGYTNAVQIKYRLMAQGTLEFTESLHGWKRFFYISPKKPLLIAFFAGILLVIGSSLGHITFSRWPIHPVMFLVWNTDPRFAASFIIGWAVRRTVIKYGGEKSYNKLKPLMFGMIAGDMVGQILPVIIGLIYHYITGKVPVSFDFA